MKRLVVFIAVIIIGFPLWAKDEARRLYESEQYEDAIHVYDRILGEHPDWEEAHFGRGASLYKSGNIDEAMREFELAIPSKDATQKSAAFYNMGNAFLKNQRLEESMRFYKRALELNPKDYDAKHNFELARQMMQQQQQQQQNQQNQDQQNQEQQDQNQPGQQDQQQDQKQEQQKQDSQAQQQPQQQPQQKKREQEKEQEEAAQVLDALKDNEKKMMQERMKTKYSGIKKEKDW